MSFFVMRREGLDRDLAVAQRPEGRRATAHQREWVEHPAHRDDLLIDVEQRLARDPSQQHRVERAEQARWRDVRGGLPPRQLDEAVGALVQLGARSRSARRGCRAGGGLPSGPGRGRPPAHVRRGSAAPARPARRRGRRPAAGRASHARAHSSAGARPSGHARSGRAATPGRGGGRTHTPVVGTRPAVNRSRSSADVSGPSSVSDFSISCTPRSAAAALTPDCRSRVSLLVRCKRRRQRVQPGVVLAAHEMQRAAVEPRDHEGAVVGRARGRRRPPQSPSVRARIASRKPRGSWPWIASRRSATASGRARAFAPDEQLRGETLCVAQPSDRQATSFSTRYLRAPRGVSTSTTSPGRTAQQRAADGRLGGELPARQIGLGAAHERPCVHGAAVLVEHLGRAPERKRGVARVWPRPRPRCAGARAGA